MKRRRRIRAALITILAFGFLLELGGLTLFFVAIYLPAIPSWYGWLALGATILGATATTVTGELLLTG